MNNTPLFLFVGRSASGKTTIAEMLTDKYGYNQVYSYTTRAPRSEDEIGHVFVNEEEFNNLGELAAYTFYNNHHYGTTFEQLANANIYVIDVPGIESLLAKYDKINRPICIIYFSSTVHTRIKRMIERGSSDVAIISRLLQDEEYDWYKKLDQLVWQYANIEQKDVKLCRIDANKTQIEVMEQILYHVNKYTED